jgi:hypothetical protein
MQDIDTARGLLQGAYDLHVHSAPDIMPRKGNDIQLMQRAASVGMAGVLIKSHYVSTADRAALVNEVVTGTRCIGSVPLNHSLGGLNPIAVDVAGRAGARLVWFPTVDAQNEVAYQKGNPEGKRAYWYTMQQVIQQQGIYKPPFSILAEDGSLVQAAREVLEVIAAHDMIMATGHIGVQEVLALAKAASESGVKRIVVTHPEFPSVAMPLDVQADLASRGAFLERCYTTPYSGKISWDDMYHAIKTVGPGSSVISTDLGQPDSPWPDEGMLDFITRLLEAGFSEEEVSQMVARNPSTLVEV